jgi:hypothetical protein
MNRKRLRFALGGKCVGFEARGGFVSFLLVSAAACCWSMAFIASEPNPQLVVWRK